MKAALEAAIGYQTHVGNKEFDVLVLEEWPGKLQPAKGLSIHNEKGLIAADGYTVAQLEQDLEQVLKRPVVLDKAPSGRFQWHRQ